MSYPLELAAEILQKAKDDVQIALAGYEHQNVSVSIVSAITRELNKLNFMTNRVAVNTTTEQFKPVTNFFGEEIVPAKDVVAADLKPTLDEKEIFLNKVAALQSTIRDRQPETLISDFSNEPLVLRKVAINAGLEDAREGIINIDFIERIKSGLDANDQRAKEEEAINQELADGANITDVTNKVVKQGKGK